MKGETVRKLGIFLIIVGISDLLVNLYNMWFYLSIRIMSLLIWVIDGFLIAISLICIGYFIYRVGDSRPDLLFQTPYGGRKQAQPLPREETSRANRCPNCGEDVYPDEKFCKACGAELK